MIMAAKPEGKFRTNKSRALLAYLVMAQGQPVLRTVLTELLWHGYAKPSALASLRQVVTDLRKNFAETGLFRADYHTVQLLVDPPLLSCDVLRFDELFAACAQHPHQSLRDCPICQSRLRQAVTLYKGPFLENLPAVDSAPFTAWVETQRLRYAERFAQGQAALHHSVAAKVQPLGNLPTPLTPLRGRDGELIELTAKLHHPVYRCLTLVGPGGIGKTRLALALGTQQTAAFPDGVWFVDLGALAPVPAVLATQAAPMAAAGEDANPAHLHDRLATTILTASGLTLQGAMRPTAQLLTYLQDKALLFILDNFEHLSAGAALLPQLLQGAPAVRLLVTSRHRLDLQGQQLYEVTGLAWPTTSAAIKPATTLIADYPSLQLFLERATLTQVKLKMNAATVAAVVKICQIVEGSPLALELAAALLEAHSLSAIAQMIQTNYQILQSTFQDLPPRQRSAQAILRTAWQLLTPDEAQTMARCAVFHGGFTGAAAHIIANATPTDLDQLHQKSLLQQILVDSDAERGADPKEQPTITMRYRMHELVRQFAAEQLAQQPAIDKLTRDRHAVYYTTLVAGWQPEEEAERAFRAAVQPEIENVETAWAWALGGDQITLLPPAVEGLAEFYEMVGAFYAAEAILLRSVTQVRARLGTIAPSSPDADRLEQENDPAHQPLATLLAALLVQLGYVYSIGLAQQEEAHALAVEALALAERLEDAKLIVRSYHVLVAIAYGKSEFARGQEIGEKAVQLAEEYNLGRERAMCLSATGLAATGHQDYATALRYLPQALAWAEQANDTRKALLFRNQLGITYREMGDFGAALHCFEQNLPATQQRNDSYNIALASANLGFLRLLLGDYDAALLALDEGYQRFGALGEKRIMVDCLAVLGHLLLQQGDYAGAATTCRRALAQPHAQLSSKLVALLAMGDLYYAQGEWTEAERAYSEAVTLSSQPDIPGVLLLAKSGLAALLLAQNEAANALAALEVILPAFDPAHFDTFFSAQRFLLPAYRILAANQDPRAATMLQQAEQIIMSYAEKISDPHLRHSFLTNVPINRQLRQLIRTQLHDAAP